MSGGTKVGFQPGVLLGNVEIPREPDVDWSDTGQAQRQTRSSAPWRSKRNEHIRGLRSRQTR